MINSYKSNKDVDTSSIKNQVLGSIYFKIKLLLNASYQSSISLSSSEANSIVLLFVNAYTTAGSSSTNRIIADGVTLTNTTSGGSAIGAFKVEFSRNNRLITLSNNTGSGVNATIYALELSY